MRYATVVSDNVVVVVDISTGKDIKIMSTDPNFEAASNYIKSGEPERVFEFDIKRVVENFFESGSDDGSVGINITNGVGKIYLKEHNIEVALNDVVTDKILKMVSQGFDHKPIVNFLGKVYRNPSKTAIDELFLFVESCELPITVDGDLIAYKIVKEDYTDIYTGTMNNSVGSVVQMPRGLVDDNRNQTCSQGLHFCSKGYLNSYGTSSRNTDRCMLVKIDPSDVVSIPSDYNNAKGRTWRYTVISEIEGNWRSTLPNNDYTDRAVVDEFGADYEGDANLDYPLSDDELVNVIDSSYFMYLQDGDFEYNWYDTSFSPNQIVSSYEVAYTLGIHFSEVANYERKFQEGAL